MSEDKKFEVKPTPSKTDFSSCSGIRIAARIHPFSHLPGTVCLLPKTHLKLQIFPTRVHFFLFEEASFLFTLSWDIQGPLKDFTVEMDLQQEQINVFGMTATGYIRYRLRRQSDGIGVIIDKLPQECVNCHLSHHNQTYRLSRGETLLIPRTFIEQPPLFQPERLSLGMHKMQDWEHIKRRQDLKEILPIWMRLGQITPHLPPSSSTKGNLSLLEKCRESIRDNLKQEILPAFTRLFLTAFDGICVPRLFDVDYQGILPVEKAESTDPSPIPILTEGAALIRSLFLKETQDLLSLLPCLPADFHAGRVLEAHTLLGDRVDFEWTKKLLRRVILRPHSERIVRLKISRQIRACRVRTSLKERGREHSLKDGILLLELSPKQTLFIDCFKK